MLHRIVIHPHFLYTSINTRTQRQEIWPYYARLVRRSGQSVYQKNHVSAQRMDDRW